MKSLRFLFILIFGLAATWGQAQTGECSGNSTDAAEGSFDQGFNYLITTDGNEVNVEFELLDPKDGLVAFAQTYNPDFAETPLTDVGDQTFTGTFGGQTDGEPFNIAVKFAFAGGLATSTIINYTVGEGCAEVVSGNVALPVTFEDTELDYELQDFGENSSQIVPDPTDGSNTVVETTKPDNAEPWAGTTVADVSGFSEPIPFEEGATTMTLRIWSPTAGTPVRLKVEQVGVPTVSVETEATTTVAEEWETLTFDFANQAGGTAEINFANTYNKASVFFNFGTSGPDAGQAFTFYLDDLAFGDDGGSGGGDPIDLPVTFEDPEAAYDLTDFGGNQSSIVEDPTDASNTVAQSIKTDAAEVWAGTTVGGDVGFINAIPFEDGSTIMTVRVWSPVAGVPIRLKVEDAGDPTISVETEATISEAETWETLTFDFANQAVGTAEINFASNYNKASMFFNFGTSGGDAGELTFYWDDMEFAGDGGGDGEPIDLPVTFEDPEAAYDLTDFGGNQSSIVEDPTDASNTVAQSIKTDAAEVWAGTTVGGDVGFINAIPFEDGSTTMTVRVWSPVAGVPIRLKVEDAGDPTISVETEATISEAETWETLTFDFANEAEGTAAINFASNYNKASMFFNFGTTGGDAGELTFYWDDMEFGSEEEPFTVVDIILGSPDHTILAQAVAEAELVDALNGEGPFTVFAPTDEAFNNLPDGVLDDLLADPTGDLQQILLYHVLGAEVLSGDITPGPQPTLQGENVELSIDAGSVFVNEAEVTLPDLTADNGVVHVIDGVLLPPSFIGLDELDASVPISVWPIPTSDVLNVKFDDGNYIGTSITIYDITGKVVEQINVNTSQLVLQTNSWNAGYYFVRIDTPNNAYMQKIAVVK